MQFPKFFIAGLLMLSASCQQIELIEPPQVDERHELNIQGVIDQEYVTRANDEGFVDGDRMGVFVVDYEGGLPGKLQTEENRANNMCYTYNEENGTWRGAGTIYWRDKNTPVDVYGYYPFENVVSSIENYEFEVKINQNKKAEGGDMSTYEASDFLWAKTSGAEYGRPVTLTYGHLMAGVQVVLQKGEGFTDTEWSKLPKIVSVDNTIRKAVVNLEKGTVTADGAYDQNVILSDEGASYRGVVVPQTVETGKSIIGVTIDGVSYNLKKDVLMTYVSGKLHTFTVTVDKRTPSGDYQLSITDEQVAAWENDKSSHSFEGKAYVVVHVEKEGTLKECLMNAGVNIPSVRNLKITGKMTTEDFEFIRSEMALLSAINMREVKLCKCDPMAPISGNVDDALPCMAFLNMNLLRSVILPHDLEEIGAYSFYGEMYFTSAVVFPNKVKKINEWAFADGFEGEVVLPDSLEFIGEYAFSFSRATGELKLPNTLKYIGDWAFECAAGFYGNFSIPSKLEYIGQEAFAGCGRDLIGNIVIPSAITSVKPGAFNANFKESVSVNIHSGVKRIERNAFAGLPIKFIPEFPEGLEYIGDDAFSGTGGMKGAFNLPSSLNYFGARSFAGAGLEGVLNIPKQVSILYDEVFRDNNFTEVYASNDLQFIGNSVFENCSNLKRVLIEENVEYIGHRAFAGCKAITTFISLAKEPPILGTDTFVDMDFEHVVLEVPEASVEVYRNTAGWNNFKYITAYHELAMGLSEVTALNAGVKRETILRAQGPWEVISCPDWCTVYPMSADTKEDLTIKVGELPSGSGNREGQIVFKLKDKDYTTYTTVRQFDYKYPEDVEIVLQEASAGAEEIPIFIVGDGFAAEDIIDGSYLELMNKQVEHFFNIEPYRTYRDYFTVTTAIAHSPESGIGNIIALKESRFETLDNNGSFRNNEQMLKDYVKDVSLHIDDDNLNKALIILMVNSECFGGNVSIENDGTTICFCPLSTDSYPYDQRGIIQHYAGGQGFGKLAQEDTYHYDFMSLCSCPGCNKTEEYNRAKSKGWYDNVSLSSKMNDVPWSHLIFHPKYSHMVDVYEGGLGHARGVFRSEINSCMNTYIPYYNTISRESIVRRIIEYAGKEYSFDDFVANDIIETVE